MYTLYVSRVLGDDYYKRMSHVTCHCRCNMLKNLHCLMAMSVEHRSKCVALQRQWRCLHMSETILEWDEKTKTNNNNSSLILLLKWIHQLCYCNYRCAGMRFFYKKICTLEKSKNLTFMTQLCIIFLFLKNAIALIKYISIVQLLWGMWK